MARGCHLSWWPARLCRAGRCQGGDFGEIVGEDAVAAPDPRTAQAVEAGAVPAVAVFEVADAAFAAGAPFDEFAEGRASLVLAAAGAGGAFAGYGHLRDAQVVQLSFDVGLAVAAVGGDGSG